MTDSLRLVCEHSYRQKQIDTATAWSKMSAAVQEVVQGFRYRAVRPLGGGFTIRLFRLFLSLYRSFVLSLYIPVNLPKSA